MIDLLEFSSAILFSGAVALFFSVEKQCQRRMF
jgi:hypothetical protein